MLANLSFATSVSASVDTSAAPGGVYKLKPGVYVARGSDCETASNAAIRQYDGRGIATAHSRACKANVVARTGSRYTVDQGCIESGAGTGRSRTERQQVVVRDALTFTQILKGAATTYRYCPAYQLPRGMGRGAS